MLASPRARDFSVALLFDPDLPAPAPDLAALGDAATLTAYAASRAGGVFLQPAPFSLPPGRIARALRSPHLRSIAVVYDFIPLDRSELYLTTPRSRRAYAAGLAALRRYDRFLPISRATESRLHALIPRSIGCSDVTGVAMRDGLIRAAAPPGFGDRAGVVVVAGDDPRKNPEVAVRAGFGVTLTFVGLHDPAMRARLAALHQQHGGAPGALVFMPPLSDAALAETYASARLVIAPSRAEGFSMPVIEAMAQATPVLASDEPAHAELIGTEDRFFPDDADTLHCKAAALLTEPAAWQAARTRQSGRWTDFTESAVAARFWAPIRAMAALRAPAILRRAVPRIAFLSPLPPALSGCADHSEALLTSLGTTPDVTVFSDTVNPVVPPGVAFGGRADAMVMRSNRYDAIVAVLGNSHFHATETRLLLDYGAAAILHDARLAGFYRGTFGAARALGVAAAERGQEVSTSELDAWMRDEPSMPLRFLDEVAAAATPLIVHAAETARFLAVRHDSAARFLPFAPYRLLDRASLTGSGRIAARARLGIPADTALIASFGHVHPGKDPGRMIDAFALVARARPCRFALLGSGDPTLVGALRAQAQAGGIAPAALVLDASPVPEAIYRDYLTAADAAVQLRRAPPGSISGALADAIAAGLPCVAAATLVAAFDPPAYVTPVADEADPAVIAAAISAALDAGSNAIPSQRDAFLDRRSMARYAATLLDAVLQ